MTLPLSAAKVRRLEHSQPDALRLETEPLPPLYPATLDVAERDYQSAVDEMLDKASAVAAVCAENAALVDHERTFPVKEFELMAQVGLLTTPLPHERGGLGLGTQAGGTLALLKLLKQIGRGSLPVGRVYEGHVNALQLIETFGTKAQKESYAADVHDHHFIFAVWNTEASDGVRLVPLAGGRYRLEGAKTFASGADWVKRPLITGTLPDGGRQMCIVPMERVEVGVDPSWWQPLGMHASVSYKLDFSGVELTADDLLGAPNDYTRQPWLSGGAIRFTAVQLGGAEALLDATVEYLKAMSRIDDPYQKARVAQMSIAVESGNLWLRGSAALLEEAASVFYTSSQNVSATSLPQEAGTVLAYVNMTRSAIERICLDVLEDTERAVGARGLLQPQPFERLVRDLRLYLRQPAPDAALAEVGRYVLQAPERPSTLWS